MEIMPTTSNNRVFALLVLLGCVVCVFIAVDGPGKPVKLVHVEMPSLFTAALKNPPMPKPKPKAAVEDWTSIALGSSGKLFNAEKIRSFNREKLKFSISEFFKASNIRLNKKLVCDKWAVLTTIFAPSEALRRFTYKSDWCVVVVGDVAQPDEPYAFESDAAKNVVFLNGEDQREIRSDFVDALPWKSFGRKNVGYLLAIAHGAKVIWDFDDDNMLKFWVDGASTENRLDLNFFADKSNLCIFLSARVLISIFNCRNAV